jgi:hypothetical protein
MGSPEKGSSAGGERKVVKVTTTRGVVMGGPEKGSSIGGEKKDVTLTRGVWWVTLNREVSATVISRGSNSLFLKMAYFPSSRV